MFKKTLPWLLCALLCFGAAAETCTGQTCASRTLALCAGADAAYVLQDVHVGDRVEKGQTLAVARTTRVFAPADGIVRLLEAEEGQAVHGSVLSILPENLYTVYCTVDEAYDTPETTLIHSGETVWMRCTANGTHLAQGFVSAVSGSEYRVLTTGGALYVGETVDLFRSADFTDKTCVGIGTVVSTDPIRVEADGVLTALHVQNGETVQRGELLFETISTDTAEDTVLTAPESGIITEILVENGTAAKEGDILLRLVPDTAVTVECTIPEADAAAVAPGTRLTLHIPAQDEDTPIAGTVLAVCEGTQDSTLCVTVLPENTQLPIGLHLDVEY